MPTLELENQVRVDEFHYKIMSSGITEETEKPRLRKRKKGEVVIKFENCIFESCSYPLPKHLIREHWKIVGIIDKKICELEEIMKVESEKKNLKYRKISN